MKLEHGAFSRCTEAECIAREFSCSFDAVDDIGSCDDVDSMVEKIQSGVNYSVHVIVSDVSTRVAVPFSPSRRISVRC